jgi:hypothetical protein
MVQLDCISNFCRGNDGTSNILPWTARAGHAILVERGDGVNTRSCKAKGRSCQNHVRDRIRDLTGLGEGDVDARTMGNKGTDIILSPNAFSQFPFAVECKNQEALNIWSALQQAEDNATKGLPLLVFKRNRSKVYCAMGFEEFLLLLKSSKGLNSSNNGNNPNVIGRVE